MELVKAVIKLRPRTTGNSTWRQLQGENRRLVEDIEFGERDISPIQLMQDGTPIVFGCRKRRKKKSDKLQEHSQTTDTRQPEEGTGGEANS